MKKLLRKGFILGAMCLPALAGAETLTLFEGAADTSNQLPLNVYYTSNAIRSQMIYPAEMLSALQGKVIDKVSFTLMQTGTLWKNQGITLKMGTTDQTTFTTTSYIETGLTTVATVTVDQLSPSTPVPYTWEIPLSEPFTYTGGNLLLDFSNVPGTGNGRTWNFAGAAQTTVTGLSKASSVQSVKFLPTVAFDFSDAASESITISSRDIHFPLAFIGEENSAQLQITNTGSSPVDVTLVSSNETFSVSPASLPAMAPGASAYVTVSFDAQSEGNHQGVLTLSAPGIDNIEVDLSGIAVNAPTEVRYIFDGADYANEVPQGWTTYAEEYNSADGSFSDATILYDDFGTTLRFESMNVCGMDALAWNHANPMPYSDLYTRAYYLVSPQVGGLVKLGGVLTDLPATGASIAAYSVSYNDLAGYFEFDNELPLTWDTPLSQNGWSIATVSVPVNTRIAFLMKYVALDFFAAQDAQTDIKAAADDLNAEPEYYTLQGMRISSRPTHGMYIVRTGSTARKILIP